MLYRNIMADYRMNDEDWGELKDIVIAYFASNDIGEMKSDIEWNILTGDADADNRKRYRTSIHTLFGMLDNSPFPQHDNDEDRLCNVELSGECSQKIEYKGDEDYGKHTIICDKCAPKIKRAQTGRCSKECTAKIADECSEYDLFIGWEGDDFVIICEECEDRDASNYQEEEEYSIQIDEPLERESVKDSSCIMPDCSGLVEESADTSEEDVFRCSSCRKEHRFCGDIRCLNYYSNDDFKCPRDH